MEFVLSVLILGLTAIVLMFAYGLADALGIFRWKPWGQRQYEKMAKVAKPSTKEMRDE